MAKDDQPTKDVKDKAKIPVETEHKVSAAPDNQTKYIAVGFAGVIALILIFFAGMSVEAHQHRMIVPKAFSAGFRTGGGRFGGYGFNGQQNGIAVSGSVTAISGNNFTINQNGTTKTVKTDSNTRFSGVGISGLKSGDTVTVVGTTNSDGSIQALRVGVTSNSTASNPTSSSNSI